MFNPQPNYSGVTIQIANPAVNVSQSAYDPRYGRVSLNGGYTGINQYPVPCCADYTNANDIAAQKQIPYVNKYIAHPQGKYSVPTQPIERTYDEASVNDDFNGMTNPIKSQNTPNAYPAQYYLNNYNYGVNGNGNGGINGNDKNIPNSSDSNNASSQYNSADISYTTPHSNGLNTKDEGLYQSNSNSENEMNSYRMYADKNTPKDTDMTRSQNIIGDLDDRESELQEEKKNTKESKIVALTDEYIKSLENYLNNPNDEIRLMASKEILTRLDEDKDRYNDAALNALLNKMLQDPSKLVRIASLSAFASQLASGNDYTVQLLHNIQSNPNADKEDVEEAVE